MSARQELTVHVKLSLTANSNCNILWTYMQIEDGIILLEGCLYLRCRVSEGGVSLRFGMFKVGKRLVHPESELGYLIC